MDPRARSALYRAGFTKEGSPAAFADATYLNVQDMIVAMARSHVEDVQARLGSSSTPILLLRDLFESTTGLEVADPFYGDDTEFDQCLHVITRGAHHLLTHLRPPSASARPSVSDAAMATPSRAVGPGASVRPRV